MRYGLKTLVGIDRRHALPALWCSDEALRPRVGFKAQHGRQGGCQRGAATRQGERTPGPIGSDTLAKHSVKWHVRDLEVVFKGSIRAVAKAGVFGAKVTGLRDGPDLETPEPDTGCGQGPRKMRRADTQGRVPASEVTVYGWNVRWLIEAATKMPLAVTVGKIHAPEVLWTRALVTQARRHLAGVARRHKGVCDQGLLDGSTLWWLDQQGLTVGGPANAHMAVTAEARAQAAAGEGVRVGHRVQTVRHGQGRTACTERLATEVVGRTGLTTYEQDGTPAHGRQHHRRDCQPHPMKAVVVRQWRGQDYGPGGPTVFLTHASVAKPLQPFDADDDRRLMEHCGIKAAKQPWDLGHPPQKTERAVRIHVLLTLLMVALATADRLQCEQEATGSEPGGWQRGRRQLLEQTRDQVMVFAQGLYGIFHRAEYSL